jgi:hypothetical protein
VVDRVVVQALAFEVHDADDAVAKHERDGDFAAEIGVAGDVAGVGQSVLDTHGAAEAGGGAGDADAEGDLVEFAAATFEDGDAFAEDLFGFVEQPDGERVVVHQGPDAGGDGAQEFVEIEDGAEALGGFGEGAEGAVLEIDAAVEAGVVDGAGDAGGDEAHEGDIVGRVGADFGGLEIDDADEFVAGNHGDGHLAADGVHGVQIRFFLADVADEHRFAGFGGLAGDAFAEGDEETIDQLLAVAHGVADAEGLAAIGVEKNGEELRGDDAGDDLGDGGEEAVEIERFRGDGGDFEEVIEQFRAVAKAAGFAAGLGHCAADS